MTNIDSEVKLVKGQEVALRNLNQWANNVADVDDTSTLYAMLSGSAGTGKTYIVNQFLQANKYKRICVTAPTHKAKIVVQKMTARPAITIHSLCGLRINVDLETFDINKPQFDPLAEPMMGEYNIVIVDEASMINRGLLRMLKKTAKQTSTKLLFIGDKLQLPPVKEQMSYIFSDDEILFRFELTEIIRQSNTSPLLPLLGTMRDDIHNLTTDYIDLIQDNPQQLVDDSGYITTKESKEFLDTITNYFTSDEYTIDKSYVKYMAWTNKSVKGANKHIREQLIGKDVPNIVANDVLMSYKTIVLSHKGKETTYRLINSDDYVVEEVSELQTETPFDIHGRQVVIRSITTDITSKIYIVDPSGYQAYIDRYLLLLDKARNGFGWHLFFNFIDNYLLIEDIMHPQTNKLLSKKSIDYGYAITIHKSQGSTYRNVIINNRDIQLNKNKTEAKKLLYVACSRPTEKAIILL